MNNFRDLWIDRIDADATSPSGKIGQFVKNGFAILENAVPHDLIDRFSKEVALLRQQPSLLIGHSDRDVVCDPPDAYRVLDIHANCESALALMFAPAIREFLEAIFEEQALAFQSLLFTYGSEQGMHQDPAYVVVDPPLQLAASWIALEDVTPGSGELIYNVGSHKNDEFFFAPGRRYYLPPEDGLERHDDFSRHLIEQQQSRGQKQETFLARKGDVLIWHADLAHGGSPRTTEATRRSLVTHYCPVTATPHYFKWKGFTTKLPTVGGYFSSSWYDLASSPPRYPSM